MKPELFHRVNDGGESARARAEMSALGLSERIRIRNLHYAEVESEFRARGGTHTPAIWDGTRLHEGADAVIAFLRTRF
jgi:hypothetical protein